MSFSEEQIRKNYSNFKDEDLMRIAEQDAYGLTAEAMQILKEELTKRGLQSREKSTRSFTILDAHVLDKLCTAVQNNFCPVCNAQGGLNRVKFETMIGVGHCHTSRKVYLILCHNCARRKAYKYSFYGFFLGIGNFVGSFLNVFRAFNALRVYKTNDASEYLIEFVKFNNKAITSKMGDPFALGSFLKEKSPS